MITKRRPIYGRPGYPHFGQRQRVRGIRNVFLDNIRGSLNELLKTKPHLAPEIEILLEHLDDSQRRNANVAAELFLRENAE